jgi:hypothetical protein
MNLAVDSLALFGSEAQNIRLERSRKRNARTASGQQQFHGMQCSGEGIKD